MTFADPTLVKVSRLKPQHAQACELETTVSLLKDTGAVCLSAGCAFDRLEPIAT